MSWILSITTKAYGYIIAVISAIAGFMLFKESIKRGERERISREAAIADAETRETALKERIKHEKNFDKFSVDSKRDKLLKYTRKDNK